MRPWILLSTLLLVLAGCKPEDVPVDVRSARTVVVDPKPIDDDRQAVGEVKPRYESDLSFRVAGKVLARRVDVGACGQTRATRWRRSTRRTFRTACVRPKRRSLGRGRCSSKHRVTRRARRSS